MNVKKRTSKYNKAIKNGSLMQLQDVFDNYPSSRISRLLFSAIERGRLRIVKFLITRGATFDTKKIRVTKPIIQNIIEEYKKRDPMDMIYIECMRVAKYIQWNYICKFYRIFISFLKKKILFSFRRESKYYLHLAIQSKPPNFLGSTYPGILYEIDMTRSDIFTL